jgi:long-subunit acyl-CoA synthetase (AMP-forming)
MEPMREDDKARSGLIPRDMAILIYTSGTTGLTFVNLVDLTVKNLSEGVMFNQSLTNKLPDQHFFQL